jgi:hypothetical protein
VSGTAIAVAVTPPALAVARKLCQICAGTQSQVLRFTTLNDDGLRLMTGEGNVSEPAARIANALGATAGEPVATGAPEGNHESAPV